MSENKNEHTAVRYTHFCCTFMHTRGLREFRADIKYNNQYRLPFRFGFWLCLAASAFILALNRFGLCNAPTHLATWHLPMHLPPRTLSAPNRVRVEACPRCTHITRQLGSGGGGTERSTGSFSHIPKLVTVSKSAHDF